LSEQRVELPEHLVDTSRQRVRLELLEQAKLEAGLLDSPSQLHEHGQLALDTQLLGGDPEGIAKVPGPDPLDGWRLKLLIEPPVLGGQHQRQPTRSTPPHAATDDLQVLRIPDLLVIDVDVAEQLR